MKPGTQEDRRRPGSDRRIHSRHYRTATIAAILDAVGKPGAKAEKLETRRHVEHYVRNVGPALFRLRRRDTMTANITSGKLTAQGEKRERIDAAIIGWDPRLGFRALMPFGQAWGHAGRCWIDNELADKLFRDPTTTITGIPAGAL